MSTMVVNGTTFNISNDIQVRSYGYYYPRSPWDECPSVTLEAIKF
jgi:hypothetical protein